MVYAANRGAGVIVWVTRQVTDENRKVIDWLNEETNVSFFALEVPAKRCILPPSERCDRLDASEPCPLPLPPRAPLFGDAVEATRRSTEQHWRKVGDLSD